jgi:serine protease inhibitor
LLDNPFSFPHCSPPVELRFDRPFQFLITHWPSGLALFSGDIYEPEKWDEAA